MLKHVIYTIGHSNRTIDYFLDLLKAHQIQGVVDVRTIPKSKHNPQFSQEELSETLKEHGIEYIHLSLLGGLRRPLKDSPNTGWKNSAFRGFADYMQTEPFNEGLDKLMHLAKSKRTTILCAEALFWRCHRSLIADALLLKKWEVFHIQSKKTAKAHVLTPFLSVKNGKLIYG